MSIVNISENMHRTAKLFMDSGEVSSASEALQKLERYQLSILVGAEIASSSTLQATLLTAVNTARRCFLGGVFVSGNLDVNLLVPWKKHTRLCDAVCDLQGSPTDEILEGVPQICIGEVSKKMINSSFAIQATFDGWSGGVIPCSEGQRLAEYREFQPAGILSGALAVSEAFQHVRGNVYAGRRDVGLSLWLPESGLSWRDCEVQGPNLDWLPSDLWLIGLGHLGQAFLWTLGFLPYENPGKVHLYLQDHDYLERANDSTSPLTSSALIGSRKTRAMSEWCEERGFNTTIVERKFNKDLRLTEEEPRIALCGVDNAMARAVLEEVGFKLVIEAGLGKGIGEYLAFQVHTFPGPQKAKEKWGSGLLKEKLDDLTSKPAYSRLSAEGHDRCGITMLAGRSVGASFVGTAVSAIVVSELLRIIHGGKLNALIDGTFGSLKNRQVLKNHFHSEPFNPGVTKAREYRQSSYAE